MTNPVYRTPEWQRVRRIVLARDGRRCQIGYPGCLGRADAVDHIVELAEGGPRYALENLRAACTPCNTRKMVAWRERRRQRREIRDW